MTQKKFIEKWVSKIKDRMLKRFPSDFIEQSTGTKISLPQKTLMLGPELFGFYELLDTGNSVVYNARSKWEAKYILYANRILPAELIIPEDENKMLDAVKKYEQHIDSIIKECEKDFKFDFPDSDRFFEVSRTIFSALNLRRF